MHIILLFAAINTDILDGTTPSRTLLPKLLSVVAEGQSFTSHTISAAVPSDRLDLFAPLTDTVYDITILFEYASANVSVF